MAQVNVWPAVDRIPYKFGITHIRCLLETRKDLNELKPVYKEIIGVVKDLHFLNNISIRTLVLLKKSFSSSCLNWVSILFWSYK